MTALDVAGAVLSDCKLSACHVPVNGKWLSRLTDVELASSTEDVAEDAALAVLAAYLLLVGGADLAGVGRAAGWVAWLSLVAGHWHSGDGGHGGEEGDEAVELHFDLCG